MDSFDPKWSWNEAVLEAASFAKEECSSVDGADRSDFCRPLSQWPRIFMGGTGVKFLTPF